MTAESARVRARPSGRRAGDSGTRDAIATAARDMFAVHGFDRVSTPAVATAAAVDPALIHHFFGTKRRLFDELMALPFDSAEVIPGLLEPGLDGLGERIARLVIDQYRETSTGGVTVALVRTAASDPRAAEVLRERFTRNLLEPVAIALDTDQPELRAALCCSQLLGLAVAEHVIGLPPLVSARADTLVEVYGATLQRYLTEPLPCAPGARGPAYPAS